MRREVVSDREDGVLRGEGRGYGEWGNNEVFFFLIFDIFGEGEVLGLSGGELEECDGGEESVRASMEGFSEAEVAG